MPRFKKPLSLRKVTLKYIAFCVVGACRRMSVLGVSSRQHENHVNQMHNYVESIPHNFANEYVVEVLELLADGHSAIDVCLVLHSKCTKLIISRNKNLLQSLQNNCNTLVENLHIMKELKALVLKFRDAGVSQYNLNMHDFIIQIYWLHKLVSIDVSQVCCSDLLRSIASNCPLLERIVAEDCQLGKRDSRLLVNCPKLSWVHLESYTEPVTNEDVAFLIQNLPHLRYILVGNVEKLITILQNCTEKGRSYGIQQLDVINQEMDSVMLLELCRLFPLLKTVDYISPETTCLLPLSKLECLKALNLMVSHREQTVDLFKENNIANLKVLGLFFIRVHDDTIRMIPLPNMKNLTCLHLSDAKDVDVLSIASSCPGIIDLLLHNCVFSNIDSDEVRKTSQVFPHLDRLTFGGNYPKKVLTVLLSSCTKIRTLILGTYNGSQEAGLTDILWQKLLRRNPMENLKSLQVISSQLTRNFLFSYILPFFPRMKRLRLIGSQWHQELPVASFTELRKTLSKYDLKLAVLSTGRYAFYHPNSLIAEDGWDHSGEIQ